MASMNYFLNIFFKLHLTDILKPMKPCKLLCKNFSNLVINIMILSTQATESRHNVN